MLREMTSSALAHSFKRFARLAVAGLALAGLAACGGGGGGGSASPAPTTPEITITPIDSEVVPTEMFDAATDVVADTPVDGTLESADDVKYYRLEVAERSEFEFTLDAEAGIEITILDSNGSVIATAETASEATTTVSAPAGNLFVRIWDKGKLGWDRLNQTGVVKAFIWVAKRVPIAQNHFNVIRGIPHVNLTAGGASFEFDFRDHIQLPDGRRIVSSVSASLRGVSASIQGTTVRLKSGGLANGGVRFVLKLCVPIVNYCFYEAFSGTVARRLPTLSDVPCDRIVEITCIHDESIAPGGTYRSRNVEDYFDYPAGTQIRFVQAATGTSRVEGWTHRIVDGKLVVTVPSDPDADIYPDNLLIYLSAVDPDDGRARRMFSFTVASVGEEPAPGGGATNPDGVGCRPESGSFTDSCIIWLGVGDCPLPVPSECPIPGVSHPYKCQTSASIEYGSANLFTTHEIHRAICEPTGEYTPLR